MSHSLVVITIGIGPISDKILTIIIFRSLIGLVHDGSCMSDNWLDIDEYISYILGLGYIDDFEDLSWLKILPRLFYSC